jgi:hypothetical protein
MQDPGEALDLYYVLAPFEAFLLFLTLLVLNFTIYYLGKQEGYKQAYKELNAKCQ